MVLERAIFTTKEGSEAAFQTAFEEARELLESSAGCETLTLLQGIERPNVFLLLVEWDTVDSHMENFVQTPRFKEFAAKLGPALDGNPQMEHYAPLGVAWSQRAAL